MGNTVKFGGASGREPKEKLTVAVVRDNLGSAVDKILLTVSAAFFYEFPDKKRDDGGRGSGRTLVLEFAEFEGYSLNCNKTQGLAFEMLMNAGHLPKEADANGDPLWKGRVVPMFVKETSFEENGVRTTAEKWYPVPPDQYASAIREHNKAKQSASRGGTKRSSRK